MESLYSPQSGPPALRIVILGKDYFVPNDKLIWIFQELGFIRFSNEFCWNGDCNHCTVSFKLDHQGEEIRERACRTPAQDGMIITDLPKEFYNVNSSLPESTM